MDYFLTLKRIKELVIEVDGQLVNFNWERPTQQGKGFLTSASSYGLAKVFKDQPSNIAGALAEQLNQQKGNELTAIAFVADGSFVNAFPSTERH